MNYNNNESGNVMSYNSDGNSGPPSPPTKSSGFGGFDSSKLLILRGGNSHVRIIL